MNHLVKILVNDDGDHECREWCLVDSTGDCERTACLGEVFGYGEGDAVYKEKYVKRGGVTCPQCLSVIRFYKKTMM